MAGNAATSNTTRKGKLAGATGERPRTRIPAAMLEVNPERIRVRAYELFQIRSATGAAGDASTDWIQAEQELEALAFAARGDVGRGAQGPGGRLFARGE